MSDDEGELVFHDEIELEDFEFDEELGAYTYPCPCGDQFIITEDELETGEEVATCPSCSLIVRVIYDVDEFIAKLEEERNKDRKATKELEKA